MREGESGTLECSLSQCSPDSHVAPGRPRPGWADGRSAHLRFDAPHRGRVRAPAPTPIVPAHTGSEPASATTIGIRWPCSLSPLAQDSAERSLSSRPNFRTSAIRDRTIPPARLLREYLTDD